MAGADAQNGLHPIDKQLLDPSQWDFSDLKAIFIDCTLKRSPAVSNTQAVADRSIAIMRHAGVEVDVIRSIDHDIATGDRDEWPQIFEQVTAANILVLLAPISPAAR